MTATEIWMPVHGYEDRYQVSNLGDLRSVGRTVDIEYGTSKFKREISGVKIFQQKHNKGYLVVRLYDGKKYKSHYVHRLVAEAFVNNDNHLPQINHKDGNKSNNHCENLEWCTNKQNSDHAIMTGLNKVTKRCVCLSDGKRYFSCAAAARHYGLAPICVSEVCDGRKKTTHGMKFEFLSNEQYEQEATHD